MFISRYLTHEMSSKAPKVDTFLSFINDHTEIRVGALESASNALRKHDGNTSLTEKVEDGRVSLENALNYLADLDLRVAFPTFL